MYMGIWSSFWVQFLEAKGNTDPFLLDLSSSKRFIVLFNFETVVLSWAISYTTWMNEWISGCIDGWVDGYMDEYMDGWMDGWRMDGWMDGWMKDGWMDGWMDG